MNKKLIISTILSIFLFSCAIQTPLASLFSTETPIPINTNMATQTQILTNTPTKTEAPIKTSTPTLTITPSPTMTITQTPTLGRCEKEGELFELSGYLSLLEGSYSLDASSYIIAFYFEKTGSDRIMVKIPGGNKKNSLYFQNQIPYIRNHYNAIIPWITQGGHTTYKIANEVTITGVYITRYVDRYNHTIGDFIKVVECTPSIEAIN